MIPTHLQEKFDRSVTQLQTAVVNIDSGVQREDWDHVIEWIEAATFVLSAIAVSVTLLNSLRSFQAELVSNTLLGVPL